MASAELGVRGACVTVRAAQDAAVSHVLCPDDSFLHFLWLAPFFLFTTSPPLFLFLLLLLFVKILYFESAESLLGLGDGGVSSK